MAFLPGNNRLLDQLRAINGDTYSGSTGFSSMDSSGGVDPMAELKAHSNFATRFARNPGATAGSGPAAAPSMMMSDRGQKHHYTSLDDLRENDDWMFE